MKASLPVLLLCVFFSCSKQPSELSNLEIGDTDLASEPIIPKPVNINSTSSGFILDQQTSIVTTQNVAEYNLVTQFLADKIKLKTGLEQQNAVGKTVISIQESNAEIFNNPEAYALHITQDSIVLTASTAAGAFRGAQTIRQLIPAIAYDTLAENKRWIIPTGDIFDAPQYEYRGTMLDVSRHFFSVADVKRYIDLLAYYKINVLHLHLADDQGWRIEIKSWPKLTEIGGSTEVGGGPGGFYTQEEYSEIIRYAADHFITIVPEIDMPGHTNAASVSYPFLNGNGKVPELYTGMKVGFSTFDTRKDKVYAFIDDIVREITALSPGPYFHIGGDESHVTKKADYIYFVNRVEKIVQKYGKQMIGWDEVATTDIDSTSVAQLWRSTENKELAISKNMQIILSPASKAYLDMKYDSSSHYGLNWAGYIPVDSAYRWSPESYAPNENILGIEAPLWSETIKDFDQLAYLAFPRVIGYAELGWTIQGNRNWEDYKKRLAQQAPFLERMEVKYYQSPVIEWN